MIIVKPYVTPEEVNNGSYDPDEDPILFELNPEGPYSLGSTLVTLKVIDDSGEYDECTATIIVEDVTPPVADVDLLPALVGECSVTVTTFPTATDNCAGLVTGTTSDPLFYEEQGTYSVTWAYDDGNGNTLTQIQNVIVDDVTPPVITVIEEPITLWPPNHKYKEFEIGDFVNSVSDNCSDIDLDDIMITSVTSDELDDANGGGDGNTTEDMITDDCNLKLRKERMGNGNGRVYTIYMEIVDDNGNTAIANCQVHVPHNNGGTAIDDGPINTYEVTGEWCIEIKFILLKILNLTSE